VILYVSSHYILLYLQLVTSAISLLVSQYPQLQLYSYKGSWGKFEGTDLAFELGTFRQSFHVSRLLYK